MGQVTHRKGRLPANHPFSGGAIVFVQQRPDSSAAKESTPTSPMSSSFEERDPFESRLEELRESREDKKEADRRRFIAFIPRLLQSVGFRRDLEANLGDRAPGVISDIESGKQIEGIDGDLLFDAAYESFCNNTHSVLTLGWDGDAPGMSGAAWVSQLEGVFIVTSSDYEAEGPFDSLEDALMCECFGIVTPKPELDSETLPLEDLLEIAHRVVDWENDGDIWINSRRYISQGGKLVEEMQE